MSNAGARDLELSRRIQSVTANALRDGALAPIETRVERIEDQGIRWIVRVVERLGKKPNVQANAARKSPWLPPEPALTLGDAGRDHVLVLNKYPVIEHHLLLVTRAWADQQEALTAGDHAALWQCLRALPGCGGLGFYNGGRMAGASQRHKHLQVVPMPLAYGDDALPIDPLSGPVPFRHAVEPIEGEPSGAALLEIQRRLSGRCALQHGQPYNLLVTHCWMMLVPRVRETWQGVSLNALAFAGCLLVSNEPELRNVRAAGPGRIVRSVTQ